MHKNSHSHESLKKSGDLFRIVASCFTAVSLARRQAGLDARFLRPGSPEWYSFFFLPLDCGGNVPYRDDFAESVRRLAGGGRILFTGYVTDPGELAALYQHCRVYLHGHEFGGTNPALLQALANGCAVCALDTVFNREVLLQGRYGLFFCKKTGNLSALIAGWENQEESLAGFRGRARQRVRDDYSWERITAQYRRLFDNLMAERNAQ